MSAFSGAPSIALIALLIGGQRLVIWKSAPGSRTAPDQRLNGSSGPRTPTSSRRTAGRSFEPVGLRPSSGAPSRDSGDDVRRRFTLTSSGPTSVALPWRAYGNRGRNGSRGRLSRSLGADSRRLRLAGLVALSRPAECGSSAPSGCGASVTRRVSPASAVFGGRPVGGASRIGPTCCSALADGTEGTDRGINDENARPRSCPAGRTS